MELILEMYSGGSVFGEEFCEFDDSRQTAMTMNMLVSFQFGRDVVKLPGVAVGDNWSHVVEIWRFGSLFRSHLPPVVPVLTVMKLLCLEQPLHLVRHGIVRVVAKVGRYFVGGC